VNTNIFNKVYKYIQLWYDAHILTIKAVKNGICRKNGAT